VLTSQLYSLARPHEGMCLTGTAEIPIGGYFMGRVYEEAQLPVKVVAFGRCFRAEAGAYGGV
jgi:seryl-tRNA synthetase